MELFSAYKSMKRGWHKQGYQPLKVKRKRYLRVVRLGESSNKKHQHWGIQVIPKLKLRIPSPTKMLAWLRDAYIDTMLALEGSTCYFQSRVEGGLDGKRIPRRHVANGRIYRGLEQRMILETFNSIMASRKLYGF